MECDSKLAKDLEFTCIFFSCKNERAYAANRYGQLGIKQQLGPRNNPSFLFARTKDYPVTHPPD